MLCYAKMSTVSTESVACMSCQLLYLKDSLCPCAFQSGRVMNWFILVTGWRAVTVPVPATAITHQPQHPKPAAAVSRLGRQISTRPQRAAPSLALVSPPGMKPPRLPFGHAPPPPAAAAFPQHHVNILRTAGFQTQREEAGSPRG